MKHLTLLFVAVTLLATACSNPDNDAAAGDSTDAVQAAGVSEFPMMTKDAYAPWAKMQSEAYSSVHPADAPRAADIDIPPFPESFIISSGTVGEDNAKMRFVVLICTDAPEAVQQFYLRELVDGRGWNYADQYSVFQPGTGNDFIVKNTPFVSITSLNPHAEEMRFVDKAFAKNFITRIQVTYK
ncbi:hypothetical protein KQI65_09915 [bacterium]|nr:hypothetical protein [bacterium]